MGGVFEVYIEMGSGAMIYVSSFIKLGSSIQKLMGEGDTQTAW
jgi:putative component of toxin-antitoxin plasmid stabilization module